MQVTEGDGYYLGRVLISAQIAAGYALTLRLRHGDAFFTPTHRRGRSARDGSVTGTQTKKTQRLTRTRWLLKRNDFKVASTA